MALAWDEGVQWHVEQVEAYDPADDPLTLAFVRDQHLRVASGTAEDDYIEHLIKTSYRAARRTTRRALCPETFALIADGFPTTLPYAFVLPWPPLISVTLLEYVDENGVTQTLTASPAEYEVSAPVGPDARPGRVRPAYNTSWPSTRDVMEAVTITYRAGYLSEGSPEGTDIPDDITHGRLLMIGEMYKQRSESVQAINNTAAMLRANDLWMAYRVYA